MMATGIGSLSDKEKQTLRLIVRGYDAKSSARELGLSVHTINERLRAARRKLDVTSSREAARLLLESESNSPENSGYKQLGDAAAAEGPDNSPITKPGRAAALWIGGITIMFTLSLALALSLAGTTEATGTASESQSSGQEPTVGKRDAEREAAARNWLALVDKGDWQASFDAAGQVFRTPNTVQTWEAASRQARVPLGEVVTREAIAFQAVASPEAYEVVQFRSDFANRKGVIESVTLQREEGVLRVVGYFIN